MPIMEDIVEVAGARRSRSREEPASPSPDFNFAGSDARNAVLIATNWFPPGFADSSINSQLPLQDAQLLFQDFSDASDYSSIQQGSGGALAEADSYDWDNLLTTIDLVGTESSYDP